jgi:hypothetical protein
MGKVGVVRVNCRFSVGERRHGVSGISSDRRSMVQKEHRLEAYAILGRCESPRAAPRDRSTVLKPNVA